MTIRRLIYFSDRAAGLLGTISSSTVNAAIEKAYGAPAPAQTEQQPVAWVEVKNRHEGPYEFHGIELLDSGKHYLYAAPIAQTEQQPALGESWIPWRGGECPLPPSTPVEYRMRRDARSVVRIDLAGKLDWEHHGGRIGKSDVVAYRAALSAQGAGDADS